MEGRPKYQRNDEWIQGEDLVKLIEVGKYRLFDYKVSYEAENIIAYDLGDLFVFNSSVLPLVGRRLPFGREKLNRSISLIQFLFEEKQVLGIPFSVLTEAELDITEMQLIEKSPAEVFQILNTRGTKNIIELRHFTGGFVCSFNPNDPDKILEKSYYLFDVDRKEASNNIFNPFFCKLPRAVDSISDAYESIKPWQVVMAEMQGENVVRQGEFFFIKPLEDVNKIMELSYIEKLRALLGNMDSERGNHTTPKEIRWDLFTEEEKKIIIETGNSLKGRIARSRESNYMLHFHLPQGCRDLYGHPEYQLEVQTEDRNIIYYLLGDVRNWLNEKSYGSGYKKNEISLDINGKPVVLQKWHRLYPFKEHDYSNRKDAIESFRAKGLEPIVFRDHLLVEEEPEKGVVIPDEEQALMANLSHWFPSVHSGEWIQYRLRTYGEKNRIELRELIDNCWYRVPAKRKIEFKGSHEAEFLIHYNGVSYVKGLVTHDRREHKPVHFDDWVQVAKNLATESRTPIGDID